MVKLQKNCFDSTCYHTTRKMYSFMIKMLYRTLISKNETKVEELHVLYSYIVTLNNEVS